MQETPKEKAFGEMLSRDLREICKISMEYHDYLNLVHNHLNTLYGERADWHKCIGSYYESPDYLKAYQNVEGCKYIPTIDMDDISNMLDEEAKFNNVVFNLITTYKLLESSSGADERRYTYELASYLGLLPEEKGHAIYRWLIQRNGISSEEVTRLNQHIDENYALLNIITTILTRTFIPGFQLEYPIVQDVMTQQKGKYYYRGENAFFASSKASYFRTRDIQQQAIFDLLDKLRLCECWNLLYRFDAVKRWRYGSVNYMALAQHYGFKTRMLDLTSDLKTALFFACCQIDENGKWRPLRKDEFCHKNSRRSIGNMGGDSRYGILYRTPVEITDMKWALAGEDDKRQLITPIGYQPFMRCSHQYGYMMLTDDYQYDLLKDKLFDKYKIRLNEEICNWIYTEMDCGNAIYPNDDIPDISEYVQRLNTTRCFSECVVQIIAEDIGKDPDSLHDFLIGYGFKVQTKPKLIDESRLIQINQQYNIDYIEKKIGLAPQLSPLIMIPSQTMVDL